MLLEMEMLSYIGNITLLKLRVKRKNFYSLIKCRLSFPSAFIGNPRSLLSFPHFTSFRLGHCGSVLEFCILTPEASYLCRNWRILFSPTPKGSNKTPVQMCDPSGVEHYFRSYSINVGCLRHPCLMNSVRWRQTNIYWIIRRGRLVGPDFTEMLFLTPTLRFHLVLGIEICIHLPKASLRTHHLWKHDKEDMKSQNWICGGRMTINHQFLCNSLPSPFEHLASS